MYDELGGYFPFKNVYSPHKKSFAFKIIIRNYVMMTSFLFEQPLLLFVHCSFNVQKICIAVNNAVSFLDEIFKAQRAIHEMPFGQLITTC